MNITPLSCDSSPRLESPTDTFRLNVSQEIDLDNTPDDVINVSLSEPSKEDLN